jgi:hypothetical protein
MYNPVESLTSPPCSELLMNQNHNEKTVVAAVVKRRKTTTAEKGMVPAALTKNRPKFGRARMQHPAADSPPPSTLNKGA